MILLHTLLHYYTFFNILFSFNVNFFNLQNIKVSVIKKIRKKYIGKENFTPEKAANASKAAAGLCKWVLAMESYDRVAKVVAPKKALLAKSEGDLKIVLSELGEKKGTKERHANGAL